MNEPGSNGAGYRVVYLAEARESLERMREQLHGFENREQLAHALRTIRKRLRQDPIAFGEAKYHLDALNLVILSGAHRPLVVIFAVHEQKALVFVRTFILLSGPGN